MNETRTRHHRRRSLLTPRTGGGKPYAAASFRCPLEFEGEKFDCGLHLEEIGAIAPGITATVPITLLFPELLKSRLKVGSQFKLWELGKSLMVSSRK